MRIDFATLAFGYTVKAGGGTPNWATALGQGREYKINESREINELLKGIVYSSVPLSRVSSKIGKGGRMVSGNVENSPIIIAALFNNVYINNTLIEGGKYIILITRDTSQSHEGRLRFKYGPSNNYNDGETAYSNEVFWTQAKRQLGLADDACFFVYDISVRDQNELILHTIVVNKYSRVDYADSKALHLAWDKLIEEDEERRGITADVVAPGAEEIEIADELTPQWFEEKAVCFPTLDHDAQRFLFQFNLVFSPKKLKSLSGVELLNYIFLNNQNKTNLCYILEFDPDCRQIFGSIKSGTAYKYGLHFSRKNNSWATGSSSKKVFLTEEEAVELGTQIRDCLVDGAEIIRDAGMLETVQDYQALYEKLYEITDGYINRVWFLKYYALLYPEIFPPIYSQNAQTTVLHKLKIKPGDNPVFRLGQIRDFVKACNISNVMFSRIFWTYCNNDTDSEDEESEEKVALKNCLEVSRTPRTQTIHPLNSIVYGAPGTGKTYSMVEYALSIIEGVSFEDFKSRNPDRKENVRRYKEFIKAGQIVFTTFHQNYGYEEFIQGLRPDKDSETMSFRTVDGVFKTIADLALNDDKNNYVIIIDEINRANISKVFGELITLIEADKRWGETNETSATLPSGDPFAVPNNLYIVGTMNSADKSISLIDAALRRRFDFIEQKPDSSLVLDDVLRKFLESINSNLVSELDSTDLLVGHSYFMNKGESELCDILNHNIIPLLYEYFYDNRKKVAAILEKAISASGANIEVVNEKVGRLRVQKKAE